MYFTDRSWSLLLAGKPKKKELRQMPQLLLRTNVSYSYRPNAALNGLAYSRIKAITRP